MKDYVDYELSKLYELEALSDAMSELGFTEYDDYINFMENEKAEAQIMHWECERGY